METTWPGEPHLLWDVIDDDAVEHVWVPSPDDLPAWHSPQDLHRHFAVVPPLWQRGIYVIFVAAFLSIAYLAVGRHADWDSYGTTQRVFAVVLVAGLAGWALVTVALFAINEVKVRRQHRPVSERATELLHGAPPIWGVLTNTIRLNDRTTGTEDSADDLQFLFDLRAPRRTLQRQRAVVAAWVSAVADIDPRTNMPRELATAFEQRDSVHCADVFGESMRGVWIGRKRGVLPYEVLGLALRDPRSAETFTSDDVVFTRRPARTLRRRSRLGKAERGGAEREERS